MRNMTKIKICGLTRPEEAACLNETGADYAGFVLFYPKSPRNISLEAAKPIMAMLDKRISSVAVCVNPSISQVNAIIGAGFDLLQIHGQLFPEVAMNSRIPVWKVCAGGEEGELRFAMRQPAVQAVVLDAGTPGSGRAFDWERARELLPLMEKPMVLAGGLTPENVREGLSFFHPFCVDTSSGVEWEDRPKGSGKDPERIRRFIEAVREWDIKKTQS